MSTVTEMRHMNVGTVYEDSVILPKGIFFPLCILRIRQFLLFGALKVTQNLEISVMTISSLG